MVSNRHMALVSGGTPRVFFLESSFLGWCLYWDWDFHLVRAMRGMDLVSDVGEVFVVDWACSVGWASGRREI